MKERKSWASSETAKRPHAVFECLSHNLCLLMEQEMKSRGLKDVVEGKKAKAREKTRRNREGNPVERASDFIGKAIAKATQRTVRFIRWLRAALYGKGTVADAMTKLKRVWYPKKS